MSDQIIRTNMLEHHSELLEVYNDNHSLESYRALTDCAEEIDKLDTGDRVWTPPTTAERIAHCQAEATRHAVQYAHMYNSDGADWVPVVVSVPLRPDYVHVAWRLAKRGVSVGEHIGKRIDNVNHMGLIAWVYPGAGVFPD